MSHDKIWVSAIFQSHLSILYLEYVEDQPVSFGIMRTQMGKITAPRDPNVTKMLVFDSYQSNKLFFLMYKLNLLISDDFRARFKMLWRYFNIPIVSFCHQLSKKISCSEGLRDVLRHVKRGKVIFNIQNFIHIQNF